MKTNGTTPIPQGYKATPLGIIPQEWKTIRLKECFSISAGRDVQKDCFSPFFLHNINIQSIQTPYLIMGCMASHLTQDISQIVLP